LLVESYLHQIEHEISICPYIVETKLRFDKRALHIAFIECSICFIDGSSLHFIEFIDTKNQVDRYKYSFHYQDKNNQLIFRYDMAPHHKNINSFPHHKHFRSEENVISAEPPTISDILCEIVQMIENNS
jgi:hypothetical protein